MNRPETMQDRLDRLSTPEPNSGCILWLGGMAGTNRDRPILKVARRMRAPSHLVLELSGKPMPKAGMFALHRCDNPACINPGHLRWGTHQDNMDDMKARNRVARAERNAKARLSKSQVKIILADSRRAEDIGAEYGVSRHAINCIRARRTWRHIG